MDEMVKSRGGEAVKSAARALDILEMVVRENRPTAANEIAAALSIPVSSLSYLLTTLHDRDYLRREGRRYAPGPALERLQPGGKGRTVKELADPVVRSLRDQLNETVAYFTYKDFEMEAISSEIGLQALRFTVETGMRPPLYAFAAGKALLAAMRDDEVRAYLHRADLRRYTDATICEEGALLADIAETRRRGIALAREEHTRGIYGFGKAVLREGAPVGAISAAIPVARHTPDIEIRIIEALARAARVLEESGIAAA